MHHCATHSQRLGDRGCRHIDVEGGKSAAGVGDPTANAHRGGNRGGENATTHIGGVHTGFGAGVIDPELVDPLAEITHVIHCAHRHGVAIRRLGHTSGQNIVDRPGADRRELLGGDGGLLPIGACDQAVGALQRHFHRLQVDPAAGAVRAGIEDFPIDRDGPLAGVVAHGAYRVPVVIGEVDLRWLGIGKDAHGCQPTSGFDPTSAIGGLGLDSVDPFRHLQRVGPGVGAGGKLRGGAVDNDTHALDGGGIISSRTGDDEGLAAEAALYILVVAH